VEVKLGCLEDLDLSDVDVLKRVDALSSLLDLPTDDLGDELLDELLKVAAGRLADHDLEHLLADLLDLGGLCVCGALDLVGAPLGEPDGKETDEVAVGRLDVDVCLDERLPLAHERAELVRREVHPVEVGQAVLALNLVHAQLDLPERVLVVLVQVGKRNLNDSALERVVGVFCTIVRPRSLHILGLVGKKKRKDRLQRTQTRRSVDEGLANIPDVKDRGSLDVVPVLKKAATQQRKKKLQDHRTNNRPF
jgi:hypothetical protein